MAMKKKIGPRDGNNVPKHFRGEKQAAHHIRSFLRRVARGQRMLHNAVRHIVDTLRAMRCRIERMFLNASESKKVLKARNRANQFIKATLAKMQDPLAPLVLKAF